MFQIITNLSTQTATTYNLLWKRNDTFLCPSWTFLRKQVYKKTFTYGQIFSLRFTSPKASETYSCENTADKARSHNTNTDDQ